MLFPEPIEDPLRRVTLPGGTGLVLFQHRVDYPNPPAPASAASPAAAADTQAEPHTPASSE